MGSEESVPEIATLLRQLRMETGDSTGAVPYRDAGSGGGCAPADHGGAHQWVSSVVLSADGSRVVSDLGHDGAPVEHRDRRVSPTLEGHTDVVTSVVLSVDGSRVVSGSWDKTVRLWDTATGECLRTLEGHTSCVPGGAERGRVSGGVRIWDNTVRLWNTATESVPDPGGAHQGVTRWR